MMPLDTALILRAMVIASELGSTWTGDQNQQNEFSKLLDQYGLKSGGDQRDKNPGGSRTYEAQMRSLGFLYKNNDGRLKLTQSGQDLVDLIEPSRTFEFQVLKYQYPSEYSLSRNVNIDPRIKIRPFLFLLKLASDEELNGLSDVDMIVPVVHGKDNHSYKRCKDLILKLRSSGFESVIPDDASIRTIKTINNSYQSRISDLRDIANTFKNVLQGSGLVDLRDVGGELRVFPRHDIKSRINEIDAMPYVDFINLTKEQASLRYGARLGALKDTRRTFMPTKYPELITKSELIYQKFLDEVELPVTQIDVHEFVLRMSRKFNLNQKVILEALNPILSNIKHYSGARLVELSKGGPKSAEAFEKNVTKIFEVDFGFEATWTGRKVRDKTGGYMDVFVVEIERNLCGIIDTKSTTRYDLPHADFVKATHTYIDTASELYGNRNLELKFVAYISHVIGEGAQHRAQEMYDEKHVPISLISAYGLNYLRSNNSLIGNTKAVTNILSKDPVNLII